MPGAPFGNSVFDRGTSVSTFRATRQYNAIRAALHILTTLAESRTHGQITAEERQTRAPPFSLDHPAGGVISLLISKWPPSDDDDCCCSLPVTNHEFGIVQRITTRIAQALLRKRGEWWW